MLLNDDDHHDWGSICSAVSHPFNPVPLNSGRTLLATPELFYTIGVTQVVKDLSWSVNAFRLGITLSYSPRSTTVETPPQPEPKAPSTPVATSKPALLAAINAFGIDNDGPSVHEFVVLRTDDAPDALPVENGVIPEDQIDLIDEVEDLAPGTSSSLDVNLDAGAYVLVCNLPAHYEQGMFAAFTVA